MDSKHILKEDRIQLMINTKLLNKNEYDIIKEKIEANKNTTLKTAISYEDYNAYNKFNYLFGYYFFCKSNLKNTFYFKKLEPLYNYLVKIDKLNDLDGNIFDEYNILNTYMFYDLWDNPEQKKRYKNAYLLLNNNIEYDKETNTFFENETFEKSLDTNVLNINKLNREDIRLEFIIELLKIINISDIRKNYYYTNNELLKILFNKFDDLIKLDKDYNNRLTELNIQIIKNNDYRNDNDNDVINKKYKNIIQYLNKWFRLVNLKIKYINDNTTKEYGKLKIGFNEKYQYNTFENLKNDMKNDVKNDVVIPTNVKKYKKGYVDENNRPVYKYITTKYFLEKSKQKKDTSKANTNETDTNETDTNEADTNKEAAYTIKMVLMKYIGIIN
jgi:hypothetical protein